jgi:hypothetical protein
MKSAKSQVAENVSPVRLEQIAGVRCIVHVFCDHLTEEDALERLRHQRDIMSTFRDKVTFVWDCRKMTGYDSAARRRWQEALRLDSERIVEAWVVSESVLIRMGASVIGLLAQFPVRACTHLEEVQPTAAGVVK